MFEKASVVSQTPVAPVIAAALVGAGVQANGKCPSPTKRPGDNIKGGVMLWVVAKECQAQSLL